MESKSKRGQIKAVLGPTNTGKTWYAIDRMLGHQTGMIGLPLRLLAREVYDQVRRARGPQSVALVTGEERIVPAQAVYWVCTVEAMPQATGVDFLAVDEIQLCGDAERGHVFTRSLLSARGRKETVFLGSDTMRPTIESLVPEATFLHRARMSELTYTGSKKISRIRPRSAIVGFSVEDVYAIAEAVRQRRGGAAVVLGALSPRTRNAQVDLYQSGEVEVLVATDAIGMGLNLDIDHVAFAGLTKFDGRRVRPLWPHEIGQIAGRAGRYQASGSFGVTSDVEPLNPMLASSIENGRFRPLKQLQWRNDELSYQTVDALLETLQVSSENPILVRARESDDLSALRNMAELVEIRQRTHSPADVRLLWEVCQIPDFRKISLHDHTELLTRIFTYIQEEGQIPHEWLEKQICQVDRIDGDVDALSRRIAFVRTWTYLSQRSNWLQDSRYWQERTRSVEDQISDALHRGLTRRFVDRRMRVLKTQLKRKEGLLADLDAEGVLTVEGESVGRIEGFQFSPDKAATADEAKTLRQASAKALSVELSQRALQLYNAPDKEIGLTDQGGIMWGENAIGKLVASSNLYEPEIEIFVDDEVSDEARQKIKRRLQAYIKQKISTHCAALLQLKDDPKITGLARGVAYRIYESFGVVLRSQIAKDLKSLPQDSRKLLRAHGVRFGQHAIFVFSVLKPEATRFRLLLWSLKEGLEMVPPAPPPGLVTIETDPSLHHDYYPVVGFFRSGKRSIRIDMLDRLSNLLRDQDGRAGFEASTEMLSICGLSPEGFADLLAGLGYRIKRGERLKQKKKNENEAVNTESQAAEVNRETPVGETETSSEDKPPEIELTYTFFWKPKWAKRSTVKTCSDQTDLLPAKKKRGNRRVTQLRATDGTDSLSAKKKRGNGSVKPSKKQRKINQQKKARAREATPQDKPLDPDNPFAVLAELKDRI